MIKKNLYIEVIKNYQYVIIKSRQQNGSYIVMYIFYLFQVYKNYSFIFIIKICKKCLLIFFIKFKRNCVYFVIRYNKKYDNDYILYIKYQNIKS